MNDDLISRQAAIEAVDSFDVLDGYQDKLDLKSKIEKLPSAKNTAFEEVKAELYEREVQAQADKERYPDNEYLEGVFDGLHEAAKLMSFALPTAEKKDKWIPVSERLPEDDETVLCTLSWGGVQEFKFMGKRWYGSGSTQPVRSDYILAWMPLPEPYKEER